MASLSVSATDSLVTPRLNAFAQAIADLNRIQELADDLDALNRAGCIQVFRDGFDVERFQALELK